MLDRARAPRLQIMALRILRPALALLGGAAVLVYLGVAIVHLRYPFELEWIEGGMVDEVRRLVDGEKLYLKPTLDYVPYIYAPLWFYIAAAFSKVFGVGFFAARLVSFLASLGSIALVARFVHAECKDRLAALAAAGAFAATYPIAAAFYDLARVDSLFIVLLLGGLYLVRFHPTTRATIAAAALLTLAFLTKQSGPIVFAPAALYVWLEDRRRGILFAATGAALMLGSVIVLDRLSDGWFWHFVFTLPVHHPRVKRVLWTFWFDDLLGPLAVACLFSLFYVLVGPGGGDGKPVDPAGAPASDPRRFYVLAAAGMLGVSLAGRLHLGGWSNVCAPAYAFLAVLFGLGLHGALARAAALPARGLQLFALVAGVLQLASLLYDPRRYLPRSEHEQAWRGLLATVEALPGDVYVSAHGFVGTRVGKRAHAHQMALSDELRSLVARPTSSAARCGGAFGGSASTPSSSTTSGYRGPSSSRGTAAKAK